MIQSTHTKAIHTRPMMSDTACNCTNSDVTVAQIIYVNKVAIRSLLLPFLIDICHIHPILFLLVSLLLMSGVGLYIRSMLRRTLV